MTDLLATPGWAGALRPAVDALAGAARASVVVDQILAAVTTLTEPTQSSGVCATVYAAWTGAELRVQAATGVARPMRGRTFPVGPSALAGMLGSGTEVVEMPARETSVPDLLAQARVHWVGAARAAALGRTFGAVYLFTGDAGPLPTEVRDGLRVAARLAAMAYVGDELELGRPGSAASVLAEGLAVVDVDGRVRAWSGSAGGLTGRAIGQVVGRPARFPIPEPGQVVEHRLPSGRWIEVLCAQVRLDGERVVTFRDVTRAKLWDEARDLFAATTSHKLRSPVTVVKGFADTLVERWDELSDYERREAAGVIAARVDDLASLVERLLRGARVDADTVAIQPAPYDLPAALRAITLGMGELSRAHPLRLEVPDELPQVCGDRGALGVVVDELLTNAARYCPDGGEVVLAAGNDATSAWVRVLDRGVGVDPADAERVFERFWQGRLDGPADRRQQGMGLGLYLVRRLVEAQGGWVSVRPRAGGGTVVEVRLRLADPGQYPQSAPVNS